MALTLEVKKASGMGFIIRILVSPKKAGCVAAGEASAESVAVTHLIVNT